MPVNPYQSTFAPVPLTAHGFGILFGLATHQGNRFRLVEETPQTFSGPKSRPHKRFITDTDSALSLWQQAPQCAGPMSSQSQLREDLPEIRLARFPSSIRRSQASSTSHARREVARRSRFRSRHHLLRANQPTNARTTHGAPGGGAHQSSPGLPNTTVDLSNCRACWEESRRTIAPSRSFATRSRIPCKVSSPSRAKRNGWNDSARPGDGHASARRIIPVGFPSDVAKRKR